MTIKLESSGAMLQQKSIEANKKTDTHNPHDHTLTPSHSKLICMSIKGTQWQHTCVLAYANSDKSITSFAKSFHHITATSLFITCIAIIKKLYLYVMSIVLALAYSQMLLTRTHQVHYQGSVPGMSHSHLSCPGKVASFP